MSQPREREGGDREVKGPALRHAEWYDALPQLVWCADTGGNTTFVNRAWVEYTGVARQDAQGASFAAQVHPDDRDAALDRWRLAWMEARAHRSEFRLRAQDGTYRWFVSEGRPLGAGDGRVGAWVGSCTDIHERKLAEAQNALWAAALQDTAQSAPLPDDVGAALSAVVARLSREGEGLRHLLHHSPVGLLVADEHGRIVEANPAFLTLTGATQADLDAGLRWAALTPPEYAGQGAQVSAPLQQNGPADPVETQFCRKDGSRVPVLIATTRLDGPPARTLGYAVDLRPARGASGLLTRVLARMAALQLVAIQLGGAMTRHEVLDTLFEQGFAAAGASAGMLAVLAEDGQHAELLDGVHMDGTLERVRRQLAGSVHTPLLDTLHTRAALYLPSRAEVLSAYPQLERDVRALGTQAVSALPLELNGRAAALVLSFASAQGFDALERSFLETLARQAEQALTRVALTDALRLMEARSAALAGSAGALLAPLSRQQTLDTCTEVAQRHLHTSLCAVAELSADGAALTLVAQRVGKQHGWPQALLEQWPEVPVQDHPLWAEVVRRGEGVYLPTRDEVQARWPGTVTDAAVQCSACLPLRARGRVIGVLTLHFPEPHVFDLPERQFLAALCAQMAVALDRAALTENEQHARTQAEGDRAWAQANEERWQLAMHASGDVLWDRDIASGEVYFSERWRALVGHAGQHVPPRLSEWEQHVHPDDLGWVKARIQAHLRREESQFQAEYRVLHRSGETLWVLDRGQALWDEHGRAVRMVGALSDVTARRRTEEELRRSRALLESIVEATPDLVLVYDPQTRRNVYANDRVQTVLGYAPAQLREMTDLGTLLHPDDVPLADAHPLDRGEMLTRSVRVRQSDGEYRWLATRTVPLRAAADDALLLTVAQDVTEQRQAEQHLLVQTARLHEQGLRLRLALEAGGAGIWVLDMASGMIERSPETLQVLGVSALTVPLQDYHDRLHPEERAAVLARYDAAIAGGETRFTLRHRFCTDAGTYIWVEQHNLLERDAAGPEGPGQVTRVIGTSTDITERMEAEAELQGSKARLEAALLFGQLGLWEHDPSSGQTLWMGGMNELYGLQDGEVPHDPAALFAERVHPEDHARVLRATAAATQHGTPFDEVFRVRLPGGAERVIRSTARPLHRGDGAGPKLLGVNYDFSAQRAAEQALETLNAELEGRVKERTAELSRVVEDLRRSNTELERFAYVASHDLQEPIRTVSSFAELLSIKHGAALDASARRYLEMIVKGSGRMKTLVDDLLTFSRLSGEKRPLRPVPLQQVLDEALARLDARLRESGASVTHEELPLVLGDAPQLVQVLQNLIGNALKFTRDDAPPQVQVTTVQSGAQWQLCVSDNGLGIEEAYLERVFEMFQRLHTRERFAGTGLGLSICQKIVETHGGRIWVSSVPGEGSRFYFTLSAAE